ncbi:nitrite reductase, copper-containing [Candidatus Woesearchaeota archaeon]|nr:nitrite reductase, copper-containing [Candidatus Woesearchaeota archaeon]
MHIFPFELFRVFALVLAALVAPLAFLLVRRRKMWRMGVAACSAALFVLLLYVGLFAGKATAMRPAIPYFGRAQGPFEHGPELPLSSALQFFLHLGGFRQVADIAANPAAIPEPIFRRESMHLTFNLTAEEVLAEVTNGSVVNYWTFNGQVPGPLLRARVGDTITVNLHNAMSSLHTHSVDFHAVTGPGGGAVFLQVPPGETKSLTWKALNPGLYVYHCASSHSVATHMAHGQYGLILIEPEGGLPPVDREFYVMQGEIYTRGDIGDKGLQAFDTRRMLDELPTYVVFNGRVGSLQGKMEARVGERVRIFLGNGGVGKVSSFHVIGEIFDEVYPEGAMGSETHRNVQSTIIPAGGSSIVEFTVDVPGRYVLVDHALARMDRGAWGVLEVKGEPAPDIYKPHVNG